MIKEEKEFHKKRNMFYINNEKEVVFSEETENGHYEWLVDGNIISKEDFDLIVRGFAMGNSIYYYQGDFEDTKNAEIIALQTYKSIINHLSLSEDTKVYVGMIKGKLGDKWTGKRKLE